MAVLAKTRRANVTTTGWIYLAIMVNVLAAGLIREINLLLAIFGLMAGPLLFNWLASARALRWVSVRREHAQRIMAGELLDVTLILENGHRRRTIRAVGIEDDVRHDHPPLDGYRTYTARVIAPQIPPAGEFRLSYRERIPQRGVYGLGPIRLTTAYPFGLIRSRAVVEVYDRLTVQPRTGSLARDWRRQHWDAGSGATKSTHQQGLVEGDFHGLRGWRSGDSRRWIHWRTSARRGSLMVRQFEQAMNPDTALLVDLWQPRAPTVAQRANVELAVSFAATLAGNLCRQGGGRIAMAFAGTEIQFIRGPASMALLTNIMDVLARIRASDGDHIQALIERVANHLTPGVDALLVSTRDVDVNEHFESIRSENFGFTTTVANRIHCIDTGAASFGEVFHAV